MDVALSVFMPIPINLALQGGGSHGAFTWGSLDALLADGRVSFEGLSGASAGAVNAVALASGWATAEAAGRDPRDGARESLTRLWTEVGRWGQLNALHQTLTSFLWSGFPPEFAPTNILANAFRGLLTPDQANPLDINPLRDLLEQQIDFDVVARHAHLKVYVSATHVNTGKAVIFSGARVTAPAVLASACLPLLFKAVEIDGEPYWDGGYSVNPALSPLVHGCASADLMLIQINPLMREVRPGSPTEILDRINELTFNASLLTQMRAIEFINRLLDEGALPPARCKRVRVHRIDGGAALQRYPGATRTSTDGAMIRALFELGQTAARGWLESHYPALGRRSTVDIPRDYLDDTQLNLETGGASPRPRGWRHRLAQLLRRGLN